MRKNRFFIFFACLPMLAGCDDDSGTVAVIPEPPAAITTTTATSPQTTAGDQAAAQPLQNVPWSWQYTINQDGNKIAPDHPENYVLLLRSDGGIAVRADCNRGGSAFKEQEDGKIVLEAIAMTKMLCPSESKGNEFIADLHRIERYRIDGHTLTLILRDRSAMLFTPLVTP